MNNYQKDYNIENNTTSVVRSEHDDTLYVLNKFLNQYHNQEKPVLDLGSGDGHYHTYFPEYTFIGLDKNKTKNSKPNDLIVEQNIEEFPYKIPRPPFDFIFSLDVLEHLERPDEVLNYLNQDDHILNKNGYVFLSVPNINTLDDKLNNVNQAVYDPIIKKNTSGRWNSTHLRFFDFDSLINMCEYTGYKVKAITGSNFHTSYMFKQLGESLFDFGLDGINFGNALRNSDFSLYAPNICILIQK